MPATNLNVSPRRSPDLLRFHRPKIRVSGRASGLLTEESKQCLRNLAAYKPPKPKMRFPRSRRAAVLVALFVGRHGDLYVLLSRRAATLRTYAGDTSLPGGKVEPSDNYLEDTARREAFEEIGLPMDRTKVPLLCMLEPFPTINQLIVTPVVVLILDRTLRPILNAAEVVSLFSHPLASFLSSTPPFPSEPELQEVKYHTYTDKNWYTLGPHRLHSFLTGREAGGIKPVFGLTAAILIRVAIIGYGREADFEVTPPDGPSTDLRTAYCLLFLPLFRQALKSEGIINLDDVVNSSLRNTVMKKLEENERRRYAPLDSEENEEMAVYEERRRNSRRRIWSRL